MSRYRKKKLLALIIHIICQTKLDFQPIFSSTRGRNHEFDCVVLYDQTHGSRDIVYWFKLRKDMKMLGRGSFRNITDRLGNLDDPTDFLTELVTVGMGQTYVLTSRLKSMDKIDFLAKQGKFLGGYTPLGYLIKDGQYLIDRRKPGMCGQSSPCTPPDAAMPR